MGNLNFTWVGVEFGKEVLSLIFFFMSDGTHVVAVEELKGLLKSKFTIKNVRDSLSCGWNIQYRR